MTSIFSFRATSHSDIPEGRFWRIASKAPSSDFTAVRRHSTSHSDLIALTPHFSDAASTHSTPSSPDRMTLITIWGMFIRLRLPNSRPTRLPGATPTIRAASMTVSGTFGSKPISGTPNARSGPTEMPPYVATLSIHDVCLNHSISLSQTTATGAPTAGRAIICACRRGICQRFPAFQCSGRGRTPYRRVRIPLPSATPTMKTSYRKAQRAPTRAWERVRHRTPRH